MNQIIENSDNLTGRRPETEVKPLQSWPKAPQVSDLKQDLQDAKPLHDQQVRKISDWLDNLHIRGKAKLAPASGRSGIQPKLIRKQAEWRYAALSEPFLSTNELFSVEPVTFEDGPAATQNQLLLNYQFNTKLDKVKFIDKYVRAAVNEGTVIIKAGWCFEEEEVEVDAPKYQFTPNPALAPLHEEMRQMLDMSPDQYQGLPPELQRAHELYQEDGTPYEPIQIGTERVKVTKTVKNHPTAEICRSTNVVFDPTCEGDIEKAGFAIHSFSSSIAALKKYKGRYKNLNQIQITSNSPLSEPDTAFTEGERNFQFSDNARKKFVVHEYWGFRDILGDGVLVPIVAAWVGNTMIRLEKSPMPDKKLPFIVEQYLPVDDDLYGEPDGALLEDNQKVIGAVTRGMVDMMGRSANGQTGVAKNMLDATNRRKFDKGQDFEFNPQADPRQAVWMGTYPEIPQSAPFMIQHQQNEADSMTGVQSWNQGISGQALGDVAAGVRGALDAASKRELGILRRLSNGIIKLGRKFIAMNAALLSEEEVVRVTNEKFVPIRRDDLAGNFDLKLSISTAEEDNNKAEQLAFMMQTMGPNTDLGITKMILSKLFKLRKMPELAHAIENFEPQQDPLAQRRAIAELEVIEAEAMERKAKAMERQAAAQLALASIPTEAAKQRQLNSQADQQDLNFVEQESGVTQERAKELHGEQARAQAQLKMTEHQLNSVEKDKDRNFDLVKEHVKGMHATRVAQIGAQKAAKSKS